MGRIVKYLIFFVIGYYIDQNTIESWIDSFISFESDDDDDHDKLFFRA